MKNLKKSLSLLLVLLLLAPVLAACQAKDENITIHLWHIYIDETDRNRIATDAFIAQFEADHPNVKIEPHILQDADYKDKILTEFSGNAENIDVFSYWGAGRAGDLVDAGKLLCVEDYLSADKISMIKAGADNNFRYGGKLYGLPMASWMMVLYCNQELFDQYNVKLPDTYDEWLSACETFATAGVIPIALGGGIDDAWQAAFVYEALVNRIVGAAAENEVLSSMSGFAANPGFREAAEKMIAMTAVDAFGTSPLEIDEMTSNSQFLSGAAAMRLTGSWFTDQIYTLEDSVVEGKVVGLPIPKVPGGNGLDTDYVGGFIDGYFVNKATKNPDIAADFAFGLCVALGTRQHEIGEGFTAYDSPVDESGLYPLGREIADMADSCVAGFVAWDTFLPGDLADIHLDATQNLLSTRADIDTFMDAYKAVFD